MNKTLFEINESMMNLLEYGVDDETGEVIETEEEFNELYNKIELDLHTKIDNTNCLGKILDGEIEVIDKEIKRLQSEKKSRERKKEWLKNNVDTFIRSQFIDESGQMDYEGLHKFKLSLPHSKISYRKSDSVEVVNLDDIPKEYIKVKTEKNVDKKLIKETIKKGKDVKGAKIVTNYNITVK